MKNLLLLISFIVLSNVLSCKHIDGEKETKPTNSTELYNALASSLVDSLKLYENGSIFTEITYNKISDRLREEGFICSPSLYLNADHIGATNTLVDELIDVGNSYLILEALCSDFENQGEALHRTELLARERVPQLLESINSIDPNIVKDEFLASRLATFQEIVRSLVKIEKLSAVPRLAYNEFFRDISDRYSLSNYTDITEQEIKDAYRRAEDLLGLKERMAHYSNEQLVRMYTTGLIDKNKDFDLRCYYALELKKLLLQQCTILNQDEGNEAFRIMCLPILFSLIEEGRYSIYLMEIYESVRDAVGYMRGSMAKGDYIGSTEMSYKVKYLHTILKHLVQYPEDKVALNQFFSVLTYNEST